MKTFKIMLLIALVTICFGCSSLKNNVVAAPVECPVCIEKECPKQSCPICETAPAPINSRSALNSNIKIAVVDLDVLMDTPAILTILKQIETTAEGKAYIKLQESDKQVSKQQLQIAQNKVNIKAQTFLFEAYAKINKTITDNFKAEYQLIFDNKGGLVYPAYDVNSDDMSDIIINRIILHGEDFAVKDITSDVAAKLQ